MDLTWVEEASRSVLHPTQTFGKLTSSHTLLLNHAYVLLTDSQITND